MFTYVNYYGVGVGVGVGVIVGVGVGVGVGKVLQSYTLTIVPFLLVLIDNCSVDDTGSTYTNPPVLYGIEKSVSVYNTSPTSRVFPVVYILIVVALGPFVHALTSELYDWSLALYSLYANPVTS
jgi:hypothetical protein